MLNRMRYYLKLPSRKNKSKTGLVRFTFLDQNDKLQTVKIPVADNPLGLLLPTFDPPRLFSGLPATVPSNVGHWRYGPADEKTQTALMAKLGAKAAYTDLDPPLFARLIAKIGHAFAAAEVGIENFDPIATDFILGKTGDWDYLVGGGASIVPISTANELHSVLLENRDVGNITYLTANVRLFSRFGAPSYNVALGRVSDEQYQRMLVRAEVRARKFSKGPSRRAARAEPTQCLSSCC